MIAMELLDRARANARSAAATVGPALLSNYDRFIGGNTHEHRMP
jgi:hypothetical protein